MISKIETTYMFSMPKETALAKEFESTHNIKDWQRTSSNNYIVYTNKIYYDDTIESWGK